MKVFLSNCTVENIFMVSKPTLKPLNKNMSSALKDRSMLKSKKMPKEFWAEAIDCVICLSNQSPNQSV